MSPDNPSPPPHASAPLFALPGHSVLALQGPDAVAFAQAQFANDVARLAVGHWQWSAWLTAKGRVIAVFALLRSAEDTLHLVLPDFDAGELGDALRRFVFRRKVVITAQADLVVAAAFAAPLQASGDRLAGDLADGEGLELDYGTAGLPRRLRLGRTAAPADLEAAQAWAVADLRLGLPRLPGSQRELWTPQQLALDRLAAFSVSKGCYPGQEIVARTHFLGKAKRELLLLQVEEAAQAGDEVHQAGVAIGKLASVAGHNPRWALGVLPLERDDTPLQAGQAPALPQPILQGLAR